MPASPDMPNEGSIGIEPRKGTSYFTASFFPPPVLKISVVV
jgi:hypothetical protein